MTDTSRELPPRTLTELERRIMGRHSRWRFSLGRLMIASNLLGLVVAVVAWTNGIAILLLIPLAFAAPLFACLYITISAVRERLSTTDVELRGKGADERVPLSPFED